MQVDSGLHYDAAQQKILQIAHGQTPFHPEKAYKVVINCMILTGLDNHSPLLEYFDADTRSRMTAECQSKPAFFDVLLHHIVVRKQFLQSIFQLHQQNSRARRLVEADSAVRATTTGWELLDRDRNSLIDQEELRLAYYDRHGFYPTNYILNIFYDTLRQQHRKSTASSTISMPSTASTSGSEPEMKKKVKDSKDEEEMSDEMVVRDPAPAPTTLLIPPPVTSVTSSKGENNYSIHHSTNHQTLSAIPVLFASLFSTANTATAAGAGNPTTPI